MKTKWYLADDKTLKEFAADVTERYLRDRNYSAWSFGYDIGPAWDREWSSFFDDLADEEGASDEFSEWSRRVDKLIMALIKEFHDALAEG